MTQKLEGDLDILKMYLYTKTEVAMLRHLKLMHTANKKIRKYLSKSNVTNFQTLLAFTTGHIPIKLHQFPISSLPDFLWTERVRNRQTDTQRQMPL